MLIRHADATLDAAACAAIYAPFVRDTVISLEEEVPGEEEFAGRIERISATHPWLVAEHDGQVIGFAYASAHRERAAYRWAADVTVYIAQDHHRRGVGRAVYETLLSLLVRQGFHVACAGITLPNAASVGLHRALGFTEVGVYRRIGFKFGAWRDVAWMQTDLRGPDVTPAEPGPPVQLQDER
jgi:L-amino acid N-acyltransferase YncA